MERTLNAAARTFVARQHKKSAFREKASLSFGIEYRIKIDAPCGKNHQEGNQ